MQHTTKLSSVNRSFATTALIVHAANWFRSFLLRTYKKMILVNKGLHTIGKIISNRHMRYRKTNTHLNCILCSWEQCMIISSYWRAIASGEWQHWRFKYGKELIAGCGVNTASLNQLYSKLWSLAEFWGVLYMWSYLLHGLYNLLFWCISSGLKPQAFSDGGSWKS